MLSDFQIFEYGVIRSAANDLQEMLDSNVNYEEFNCVISCCDRIINACKEIQRYTNNKQLITLLKGEDPFKEV